MFWSESVIGTGASTWTSADRATVLTVSANNDAVIRQTKMRFNYSPYKSQSIAMTCKLGATVANVTKRVGLFNSNTTTPFASNYDGVYFEDDGTGIGVCLAKDGTVTRRAKADWNIDKLDGTGPSRKTLDLTKQQILIIDIGWLGVDGVRFGFKIGRGIYYVHSEEYANASTSVYMLSPNHSIRYEIRSSGGTGSLSHICCSIGSEDGSITANGVVRSFDSRGVQLDANTAGTIYAALAMRLKTTHLDSSVYPIGTSIACATAGDRYRWALLLNPTVAGSLTYTDMTDSAIQYALGATANTITAGTGYLLDSGFGSDLQYAETVIPNALRLGSTIEGALDVMVLAIEPIAASTNLDIFTAIKYRELN